MISKTKEVLKKLEFGVLEFFIGALMIIGLLGYFATIPADLDWIDHTVAFLMFSYFFYILDITSLLFGNTSKLANLLLIISYFSFFFKDVISYTEANAFKFVVIKFVDKLHLFFQSNLVATTVLTFYAGVLGIFIASIYLTKKIQISHPSFLYAVHKGPFRNHLTKFLFMFITLLSFYYLIYNPILEWLEFVMDDPIVAISIVFFIITIAKHHYKFHEKHVIFKLGDTVWGWYKKFISLFHYKKTLPLAISGILILHAVSDLGVFAYSMIFLKENFYLEFLSEGHTPFLSLFLNDANKASEHAATPLFIVYLLNSISLIILLLIPVVVWIRMFSNKEFHFNRLLLFLIYSSVTAYILTPAYVIRPLLESSIVGADISSASVLETESILDILFSDKLDTITASSLISIVFGLIIYLISSNFRVKRELYAISIIGGLVFYTVYLYYFFSSLLVYFYSNILATLFTEFFFTGIILAVFLILSIIFYIGGYFMFLYEIVMEYHRKKWSEPIDEELVAVIGKIKKIEKGMIKPKKAQFSGEVIKYGLIAFASLIILMAGYKAVDVVKEKGCKTELAKFELELKSIDKNVRYGARGLRKHDAPCKVDEIYFFDLSKEIDAENFKDIPIIKDSLKSKASNNVFLVEGGKVKRSFYSGNLQILYPYYICFLPKFDKISFFVEGAGKSVKVASDCDQPECTFIPIGISEEEAQKIIREAIEFGCQNCPIDLSNEISRMRLTRNNIDMFRKITFCEGITNVEIIIRPKKGIEARDFTLYEFIRKDCIDDLNNYLAEEIKGDVVVKADPLVLWHFDEINRETRVNYRLSTELTEECKGAIEGLGIAQLIEGAGTAELEGVETVDIEEANNPPSISFAGINVRQLQGASGLNTNVVSDLMSWAGDAETEKSELIYSIKTQSNPELANCNIIDNKKIDCGVIKNEDGHSEITVSVSDGKLTDEDTFVLNVEKATICGDGSCENPEACSTCAEDCGACRVTSPLKVLKCSKKVEEGCSLNFQEECKENSKRLRIGSCLKSPTQFADKYSCYDYSETECLANPVCTDGTPIEETACELKQCHDTDLNCGAFPDCKDCNLLDAYSANFCEENNVYRKFNDYGCSSNNCVSSINKELVQSCTNGKCENSQCICKNADDSCGTFPNCVNCASSGKICQEGVCVAPLPTCTNECTSLGQKECTSQFAYRECGTYDADSCLDWSTSTNCQSGQVCSNGNCVAVQQSSCGDTNCDTSSGESCSTCPVDCGACTTTSSFKQFKCANRVAEDCDLIDDQVFTPCEGYPFKQKVGTCIETILFIDWEGDNYSCYDSGTLGECLENPACLAGTLKVEEQACTPPQCKGTDDSCGTFPNCINCALAGQKCQDGLCITPLLPCINECATEGAKEGITGNEEKFNECQKTPAGCLKYAEQSCPANNKFDTSLKACVIKECSDGTQINSCSSNKPTYCDSTLNIINNCALCGCPSGNVCSDDGSCAVQTCSDGTNQNQCSATKPKECNSAFQLVDNCGKCGCPENSVCKTDGTCLKKAVLSAEASNVRKNAAPKPSTSDPTWFYYDLTIKENNGVGVTLTHRQRCWSNKPCEDIVYDPIEKFGTDRINPNGQVTAINRWWSSNTVGQIMTETWYGADDNGNQVSVSFSMENK